MCERPLESCWVHALLSVAADGRVPVESRGMLVPSAHP